MAPQGTARLELEKTHKDFVAHPPEGIQVIGYFFKFLYIMRRRKFKND